MIRSEHQCDRRLSWISLSVKFLPQLLWQASFRSLCGLCEIKGYFSCIFSLQSSPHLFVMRGHLWVLISQMGKKGIEKAKSSFLSQSSMRTTGFQTFSLPCLQIFLPFLAPPTSPFSLSISIAISLTRSLSLPMGLKWLKVTRIWLAFSTEGVRTAEKMKRVQQCTVNTFAPIKLVKTLKKSLL